MSHGAFYAAALGLAAALDFSSTRCPTFILQFAIVFRFELKSFGCGGGNGKERLMHVLVRTRTVSPLRTVRLLQHNIAEVA